jgi:two-component system, response regulator YesN
MERPNILLVEDDRRISEIVALFFSDAYEVKRAMTGAEAIAIVRREPVAAVVLDYRLPDCTGLEVLREIRSARPKVPVVMMTGYGSEWLCASALKLGVSDYFPKPVKGEDLLNCVQGLLSETSSGVSAADEGAGVGSQRPIPARSSERALDPSIQKAMRLIQLRYWDDLPLAGLAQEVGMSKYHLSHRFRETTGVTFRSYLLQARLERSKVLLTDTPASVTEVAHTVGFNDLARFDKLFKRHTGLTPSAYRANSSPVATRDTHRVGQPADLD